MNGFHFLRPDWLFALLPLAALLIALLVRGRRDTPWSEVVDAHLLPHLLVGKGGGRSVLPLAILGVAWTLGVLAMAGPAWMEKPAPKFRSDVPPLMVLLDLSDSMLAKDVSPNRIGTARHELRALLGRLSPRPMALIAVAGTAHSVTPITDDKDILLSMLETLEPDLMPISGSHAEAGFEKVSAMVAAGQWKEADILLIADDASKEAIETARKFAGQGLKTSVLAIGTAAGTISRGSETMAVPVNSSALSALSQSGNGVMVSQRADTSDTERLMKHLSESDPTFAKGAEDGRKVWRDDGGWVILCLLPLAALVFRRGWIALFFFVLTFQPHSASAFEWLDLWQTPDQQGLKALQDGDGAKAAQLFETPFWQGVARYRAGDLDGALQIFQGLKEAPAHYNRGNILVRQGRLHEALKAYKQAIDLEPSFDNARHNRNLVSEVLNRSTAPSEDKPERPGKAPPEEGETKKGSKTAPGQAPQGGVEKNESPGETKKLESPKTGGQGGGAANIDKKKDDEGDGVEGQSSTGGDIAEKLERGKQQPIKSDGQGGNKSENQRRPPQKTIPRQEVPKNLPKTAAGKRPGTNSAKVPNLDGESQSGGANKGEADKGDGATGTEGKVDRSTPETEKETAAAGMDAETSRALKQWMERIPDDPGGLLREKFKREAESLSSVPRGGPSW